MISTQIPPLKITKLSKSYRKTSVLSDLDLLVESGEIIGLLGVNGAGKSTLIKCILDLVEIDDGEIRIFGESHHCPLARNPLAYLSEQFRPPKFTTGNDVVKLLLGIHDLDYSPSAAHEFCDQLALDKKVLDLPCKNYSKGMRQKLGLIACLLAQKPLLILDEPMSGLDPLARGLFKDRLVEQRDNGCTVFFSTHLLEDITSVCDRVMLMDAGAVLFIGQLEELLEKTKQSTLESAFLTLIQAPVVV